MWMNKYEQENVIDLIDLVLKSQFFFMLNSPVLIAQIPMFDGQVLHVFEGKAMCHSQVNLYTIYHIYIYYNDKKK